MSVAKTLVFEQNILLSTQYSRRFVSNIRAAYVINNEQFAEFILSPQATSAPFNCANFMAVSTDGLYISALLTKTFVPAGGNPVSQQLSLNINQVLVLSDALDVIQFTNNDGIGGEPVRIRLVYS